MNSDGGLALPTPPVWRLLPVVLAAAFAARVAVVLGGDFIYHPDVVFQYLEPAWRLLTGDGLVVWEQFYGARSQLIPAALALVMMALQALGFDHPTTLRTALEVVLCGVSLFIPWGMYAFARTAFDERIGRVALVLGSAWYELVTLSGQPLSKILTLAPLVWAFALAADVRSAVGADSEKGSGSHADSKRDVDAPEPGWSTWRQWTEQARKIVEAAIRREPDRVDAQVLLATTLHRPGEHRLGEHRRVIGALEDALSAKRNRPLTRQAHRLVGEILDSRGQPDGAEHHYRSALALYPLDAGALLCLAAIHVQAGRAENALPLYRRLAEVAPCNAENGSRLSETLVRLGRTGEDSQPVRNGPGMPSIANAVRRRLPAARGSLPRTAGAIGSGRSKS